MLATVMKQEASVRVLMRERHTAQCLTTHQVKVTTLWRAATMLLSKLVDFVELPQQFVD